MRLLNLLCIPFFIFSFSLFSQDDVNSRWLKEYRKHFPPETNHSSFRKTQTDSLFTLVGRWGWGPCNTVDARGDTAFIGNGILFQALDLTNPATPKIIGEYLLEGTVYDIKVRGTLAYVLAGGYFTVLDITDLSSIKKLSSIKRFAHYLYLDGNIVYTLSEFGGFSVVDVSNPNQP